MYMKNPVNDVNTSYFSEAELRVVKLLASGSSEKEIADRLCISRHTVDNHLRNIRERFGLHKNTEIQTFQIGISTDIHQHKDYFKTILFYIG